MDLKSSLTSSDKLAICHSLKPTGSGQASSPFLGAFAKLRKETISFVMSVRLSVRMEQIGFHKMDFDYI
jgi:hypothetical protein